MTGSILCFQYLCMNNELSAKDTLIVASAPSLHPPSSPIHPSIHPSIQYPSTSLRDPALRFPNQLFAKHSIGRKGRILTQTQLAYHNPPFSNAGIHGSAQWESQSASAVALSASCQAWPVQPWGVRGLCAGELGFVFS